MPLIMDLDAVVAYAAKNGFGSVLDAFVFETDAARKSYEEYAQRDSVSSALRHVLDAARDAEASGGDDSMRRLNFKLGFLCGRILCSSCGVTTMMSKCSKESYRSCYHSGYTQSVERVVLAMQQEK